MGVRLDELRRFIHAPVRKELEDTEAALATVVAEVRRTYFLAHTKRSQQRELENEERELRSLTEQTTAIRNSLAGIDAADRVILEAHAAHEREAEIVNGWRDDLARAEAGLEDLLHTLRTLPSNAAPEDLKGLPQSTLLEAMRSSLVSPIRNAENAIESQLQALRELGLTGSYAIASEEWSKQNEEYQGAYAAAKARSTSHETRLAELDDLENRSKAIRLRLTAKRGEIADFGEPEEELRAAREQWSALHERRSDLLAAQCNRLTELSGGQIRATLLRGRVVDRVAERLKAALAGTGIRTNKIDELCQAWTAAESPVRQAQQVMTELELLGQLDASTATEAQLPQTPLLAASFGPKDLLKIATKISPEAWVDVSTSQLEDQPRFEYRLREQDYIAFADASAGQQATSLLWALLNQDGPPLLIDQPEDDLDNQVVLEIVEQIWQAKRKRQLIFASHNANLVVNGDADLVASCGYRVAGEQAGGVIKIQGAIDVAQVRSEIAAVMEGGKAAFTLRKEKYGF